MEEVKNMGRERYTEYLKEKYKDVMTVTENDKISSTGGFDENHLYTWERIYHFSCGHCKNWWSFATTEDRYSWKSQTMTCIHCGFTTNIRPNPEMSKEI